MQERFGTGAWLITPAGHGTGRGLHTAGLSLLQHGCSPRPQMQGKMQKLMFCWLGSKGKSCTGHFAADLRTKLKSGVASASVSGGSLAVKAVQIPVATRGDAGGKARALLRSPSRVLWLPRRLVPFLLFVPPRVCRCWDVVVVFSNSAALMSLFVEGWVTEDYVF